MSEDCLFCNIISKKIPARIVHEDSETLAFEDINPQAPVHILIIPKTHIERTYNLNAENIHIVGQLILIANQIARNNHVDKKGYRLVLNCNSDAGQSVFHIHIHLLGGRKMNWPPG
ncbi:MAG: histidine triad nucleotide-binding protein [Chlamydiota bacterium]|nr:histidine triad nucleotide-binding protein [Chlamydiota bacterium]